MTQKEINRIQCRILNRLRRNDKILVKDCLEQAVYDHLMRIKNSKQLFAAELASMGIEIE